MNYFVEGIQGSGKSTMVERLIRENSELTPFREGDYSPVELAWCALVDASEYDRILKQYSTIADEIKEKTVKENDMYVIMYTRILTDIPGFHQDLERFEIYNGRVSKEEFERIILRRYQNWIGDNQVFECSLFQNTIENLILYFEMEDEEIVSFYHQVSKTLSSKEFRIIYLAVDDIRKTEDIIRKERSDENGVEMWFPLMIRYIEDAPYSKTHGYKGMDGLVAHLEHRVALEKRIMTECFEGRYEIIERTV